MLLILKNYCSHKSHLPEYNQLGIRVLVAHSLDPTLWSSRLPLGCAALPTILKFLPKKEGVCRHLAEGRYLLATLYLHFYRSEENLQKSALSFSHVDPWKRTWVIRFGSTHLYLPSHLPPKSPVLIEPLSFPPTSWTGAAQDHAISNTRS